MYIGHKKIKRCQQSLNETQKYEAITRVQNGETKAAVAREFGVPESTLRGWCKKAKIQAFRLNNNNNNSTRQTTLTPVAEIQPKTLTPTYGDYSNYYDYCKRNNFSEIKQSLMMEGKDEGNYYGYDSPMSSQNSSVSSNETQHVTSSTGFSTPKIKRGWFYEWCKNSNDNKDGLRLSLQEECTSTEMENKPLNLIMPGNRRRLENLLECEGNNENENDNEEKMSVEDALKHGELFLKFLRKYSDPSISVLQAMQFAVLIKSVRSSIQRKP